MNEKKNEKYSVTNPCIIKLLLKLFYVYSARQKEIKKDEKIMSYADYFTRLH